MPALRKTLAALVVLIGLPAFAGDRLTVYSALAPPAADAAVRDAFRAAHPEIDLVWTRDPSGVVVARVIAEKSNPHADVVVGLTLPSMLNLKAEGALAGGVPAAATRLRRGWRDETADASWIGMGGYVAGGCFNTIEAARAGLAPPTGWDDLLSPLLKNRIEMPHPASSGIGLLLVAGWLRAFGEDAGWRYMDRLHDNIAAYVHTAASGCQHAARGERIIALATDATAAGEIANGAPMNFAPLARPLLWDQDTAGVLSGSAQNPAARTMLDWLAGEDANTVYARFFWLIASPAIRPAPPHRPAFEPVIETSDPDWVAANKQRILQEWSRRYEGKAAPKN
jgi:iron(III) transport system substrate-binding protein